MKLTNDKFALVFLLLLTLIKLVSASFSGSESDEDSDSDGDSIDWENVSIKTLYRILLQMDDLAESALISEDVQLPRDPIFAALAKDFLKEERWNLFELFLDKFDFSQLHLSYFWEILLMSIAVEDTRFLKSVLENQQEVIINNFRTFWYRLMSVDATYEANDLGIEVINRTKCKTVHPAVRFAFEFYVSVSGPKDELVKYASFCIFDILFADPNSHFPKSFLKGILRIKDLDFNASREGNCVGLHTCGRTYLPDYYYKMILNNPRINVNCIVPATRRKHKHISCQIPPLPLFWHALIYRNYAAMYHLWNNPNLRVTPLISSFFLLLRLTIIFIFYLFFDGKNFQGERRIA